MRDLTVGVFGHLDIISRLDLYPSIKYTKSILEKSLDYTKVDKLCCREILS